MPQPIRSSSESWHGTPYVSQSACTAASIAVGPQASGYCGIHVELGGTGSPMVDGRQISWEYIDTGDTPAWQCTSDLDDRYLPASCR